MIRSVRDKLRPVNRLPGECLVRILEVRRQEKDLLAAAGVCEKWREILISEPRLWTKIDDKYPESLSDLYLERSKNSELLDITFSACGGNYLRDAFANTLPWLARVNTLRIRGDVEGIDNIVKDHFSFQSLTSRSTYVSLRKEFAHSLENENLTHIDWVANTTRVALETLLDLFKASPRLKTITVHVLVTRASAEKLKSVTLKELRKLDWADYNGLISLIPYLIAPKLNELDIKVTHKPKPKEQQGTQSDEQPSLLLPDGNQIPMLKTGPEAVECSYGPLGRTYYLGYPLARYVRAEVIEEREVPDSGTQAVGQSLIDEFFFAGTQSLVISTSIDSPPPGDIPIVKFESLQSLTLKGNIDSLVPLVNSIRFSSNGRWAPLREVLVYPSPDSDLTLTELMKALKRGWAGRQIRTHQISPLESQEGTDMGDRGFRVAPVDIVIPSASGSEKEQLASGAGGTP